MGKPRLKRGFFLVGCLESHSTEAASWRAEALTVSGVVSLVYLPLILAPSLELLACDSISWKL